MRLLPLVALLAGCWVNSEEVATKVRDLPDDTGDTGDTGDTDEPLDPIVLDAVEPAYGTNAGGAEVRITVGPLVPDDVEVTFGGVLATVVEASEDQVTVTTPAVGVQGAVDVVVASADRTARASGAFFYWDDGTDKVGLVGTVRNWDFDRPYLDEDARQRSASLIYIEPADFEWWHLYTDAIDTCSRDYRRDGPSLAILTPGLDRMSLDNGIETVVLGPDADGEAFGIGFQPGWIGPGRSLDLAQPAGGTGWPAFTLDGVAVMPREGFRMTQPDMENSQPVVSEGFALEWTGGSPGDLILVDMVRYDFLGDEVEQVSCALTDDGRHVTDPGVWSGWSPTGVITITASRVIRSEAVLPFNGAQVGVYGMTSWYGEVVQSF